jgi:hypothetical protein
MNTSLFDPSSFLKGFIEFGLRLLIFFWIVFSFRNTRLAFWYLQQLAGSSSGEFLYQITKINKLKPDKQKLSQTKINAIETFLEFSTLALMNAKAIKEGQFEIGYYSMIDEGKLISVNAYIKRLKSVLSGGYLNWRISPEDVEKIKNIFALYNEIYEPVTSSILFVIQTECLIAIGCPIYEFYARSYYKALHNYLTTTSSVESGETLQKTEIEFLVQKLEILNLSPIDEIAKLRASLEDKDNCSLGKTLPFIKGDQ